MDGNHHIFFYDSIIVDDYRYFSSADFNGLFRMKTCGDLDFVGYFPEKDRYYPHLHRNVFLQDNSLIFTPFGGTSIDLYDIERKSFSVVRVATEDIPYPCYSQSLFVDGRILLIPKNIDTPFAIFDTERLSLTRLYEVNDAIRELLGNPDVSEEVFGVYSAVSYKDYLYLSAFDRNVVVRINWKDWSVDGVTLGCGYHFRNMTLIGDDLFLTLREHAIIKFNLKDESSEVIRVPDMSHDNTYPYLQLINTGYEYLLLSGKENVTWRIDKSFKEWKKIDLLRSIRRFNENTLIFFSYELINERLLLFPRSVDGLIEYNLEECEIYFVGLKLDDKLKQQLDKEWDILVTMKAPIIWEDVVRLPNFLEMITKY